MKNIFLLFVLSSTILFSQQRISKKLGEFNKVKVFSGLKVKLVKITNLEEQNHIEIKGDVSENVVVKNVNGLLKISILFPKAFDQDKTLVKLYYTTDLDLIDANEGAFIYSDEPINQDFLDIRAQEGAQIELRINSKTVAVKTISGAEIRLSGKTDNQTAIANTGGIYEGFDLQSKQATITASTGGEAEVNTTDLLNAKAKLKGRIIYINQPKKIIKKAVIGGIVTKQKHY